jgi:hypothetical protein
MRIIRTPESIKNYIDRSIIRSKQFESIEEFASLIRVNSKDISQDDTLKSIAQKYITTGAIDTSDIRYLIQNSNVSLENQKKILAFFVPVISLSELQKYGIEIDESALKESALNTILEDEKIENLNNEVRKDIKNEMSNDTIIDTASLDTETITKIFESDGMVILSKHIAEKMSEIGTEHVEREILDRSTFRYKLTQL